MKIFEIWKLAAVCFIAVSMWGCKTNIAELQITPRDNEVYNNPYLPKNKNGEEQQKIRIAVVPEQLKIKDKFKKEMSDNLRDSLENAISNLADFEAVPRSEIAALMNEKELNAMSDDNVQNYKIADTDYILMYKLSDIVMDKVNSVTGMLSAVSKGETQAKYKAKVRAKISLIDCIENRKAFTKAITDEATSFSSSSNPVKARNEVLEAIDNIVKNFITQFAVEYAPPAVVEQTKGGGRVALINIGKNFGLMKNTKMEFFIIKETHGKKYKIPFAYGKVIEVDSDSAWVEVDNYENAGVKINHFVRVRRDQSRSFLEKVIE